MGFLLIKLTKSIKYSNLTVFKFIIKQIFMKYKMKRRIPEMQELIKKSMEDLGNKGQ